VAGASEGCGLMDEKCKGEAIDSVGQRIACYVPDGHSGPLISAGPRAA
jgi:hypothetical protein